MSGIIKKVSGPLVIADNMGHAAMYDVVKVSALGLVGEIIEMHGKEASIQVYEETSGLRTGESVISTNEPLSIELGPGLIGGIFDGTGRPLTEIMKKVGSNLKRGVDIPTLSREKLWKFTALAGLGKIKSGDILGFVRETDIVEHKIMLPHGFDGELIELSGGSFRVDDVIGRVKIASGEIKELRLMQKWPVRKGRPYKRKLSPSEPLVTGQRVIDTLFPIARGGVAAVPGPFGSGKTIVQHQLAKWSDVDIVVYIGCGERGNEMTDVLNEFPEIRDPKTGKTLMDRTVLIANTSDMPVAAREASIYTGAAIAEYFRDMGYSVLLLADSTSRWAEALREMSGRLEEMPGEEGYPAYLASRLAGFYERAGNVVVSGNDDRTGSLSIVGAVSPQGGDISEPVSQATLRIVKVFWGLDSSLAYRRHFPAINWLKSYSLYLDMMKPWYRENVAPSHTENRNRIMALLQEEAALEEIVKLVGTDTLTPKDRLKLEAARRIREDLLHQNAFHEVDTYTSLKKQYIMCELVLFMYDSFLDAIEKGADLDALFALPSTELIGRIKYVSESIVMSEYEKIKVQLLSEIEKEVS